MKPKASFLRSMTLASQSRLIKKKEKKQITNITNERGANTTNYANSILF